MNFLLEYWQSTLLVLLAIDVKTHILVLFTSFLSVGLKGFQHKNVIGNHMSAIGYTSYAMAFCDYWTIKTVSGGSWTLAFMMGTGATIGMVGSIKLHDRIFKPKAVEITP